MKKHFFFAIIVLFVFLQQDIIAQQNIKTDIFESIWKNDVGLVERILQDDPLLINSKNNNGLTPLAMAVQVGNYKIAGLLLKKGALVNCGDNNLRSPIHAANWNSDTLMINLLLENGGVIDTRAIGAATPLIHASLSNNFEMCKYLIRKGADINIQCNSLTVPLYFAVLNNNLDYLDYLINAGAEIDVPDFLGRTPLYIAVRDGNLDVAEKLIENGASVHTKDHYLDRYLIHIASSEGHSAVVKLLLEHGSNVNETDREGFTPLDYALKYGNLKSASVIRSHGGKVNKMIDQEAHQFSNSLKENEKNTEVIKLQNGSWAVSTENNLIILGYSEIGTELDSMSLQNGHITEDILKTKKRIYVLDHDYHAVKSKFSITGSNPLLMFADQAENLSFIFNAAYQQQYGMYPLKDVHFAKLNQSKIIENLKLKVLSSYHTNLCYIMEIDGISIVWLTGIGNNYQVFKKDNSVIQRLAEMEIQPDILFLGSPSGIGPELAQGIRETYLESICLNPENVFVFGHELLESKVFYQVNRMQNNTGNLHIAENPGDRFILFEK